MAKKYATTLEAFSDYERFLKSELFFEAHEALEVLWFPRRFEDSYEVRLLRGFINAAVSFELIKRGKIEASKKPWSTYLKYLPLMDKIADNELFLKAQIEIDNTKERLCHNL